MVELNCIPDLSQRLTVSIETPNTLAAWLIDTRLLDLESPSVLFATFVVSTFVDCLLLFYKKTFLYLMCSGSLYQAAYAYARLIQYLCTAPVIHCHFYTFRWFMHSHKSCSDLAQPNNLGKALPAIWKLMILMD